MSIDSGVFSPPISIENSFFDGFNGLSTINIDTESTDLSASPFPLTQASNYEVDAPNIHMMDGQNTRHQREGVSVYESNQTFQNNQIYHFEGHQGLETPEHTAYVDRQYNIQHARGDLAISFQQNQALSLPSTTPQLPTLTGHTSIVNVPSQSTGQHRPTQSGIHSDDRPFNPTVSSLRITSNSLTSTISSSSTDLPPISSDISRSLSNHVAQTFLDSQSSLNELDLLVPAASNEVLNANNPTNPGNQDIKIKFDLYDSLNCMRRQALSASPRLSRSLPCPSYLGMGGLRAMTPKVIQRSDLKGEQCDIQGINWKEIGVPRSKVKKFRAKQYIETLKLIYVSKAYISMIIEAHI